MNSDKNRMKTLIEHIKERPDRALSGVGILLSLCLTSCILLLKNISMDYIIWPLALILPCTFWLLARRKDMSIDLNIKKNSTNYKIFGLLYFILLTCSIIVIYINKQPYVRPLSYFILTAFMAGCISLEVIFAPKGRIYPYFILIQIFILGLSISFSQMLIFPKLVGSDPWWHMMFTEKIANLAHIPKGYAYSNSAVFHLYILSVSLISGLGYKLSSMLSVGTIQVIVDVLILYLMGTWIYSKKIGLLSGLLLTITNYHIQYNYQTIPYTLGTTILLLGIYATIRIVNKTNIINIILLLFFSITLILTHPLPTGIFIIFLFSAAILNKIHKILYPQNRVRYSVKHMAIIFIGLAFAFFIWIFMSNYYLKFFLIIDYTFGFSAKNANLHGFTQLIHIPWFEYVFGNLGSSLYFLLAIFGCLYMISNKYGDIYTFTVAFIGLEMLSIAFFPILIGLFLYGARWWYIAQISLAIPSAVTVSILYGIFKAKEAKIVISTCLVTILAFLMIMSPTANTDNHLFSPNSSPRLAFTNSEITAASFFVEKSEGGISSDFLYAGCSSSSVFINYLKYPRCKVNSLDNQLINREFYSKGDIIIIREEIIHRPFRINNGVIKIGYDPNIVLSKKFSKIYECNTVSGYK